VIDKAVNTAQSLAMPSPPDRNRRLAYGFWRYQESEVETALTMLESARAHGITHFDTADIYGGPEGFGGAERLLGAVRRRAPILFEGAVLASKAGVEPGSPYNSSDAYLTRACENSLTRLGVERIDLFYIHRPDILTHPADLAATLDKLVTQGKVAAIGVSNFSLHQIEALIKELKAPLVASQIELSAGCVVPIFDGSLDQAIRLRLQVYAWSPLAGGKLIEGDPDLAAVHAAIYDVAHAHGVSPETVALAFVFSHPASVTPIIGTKAPQRLAACAKARALVLERTEWYAILEASLERPLP
jgi:predicted oxidoreductase